jgi:pSer/pThr/pTyr-binding forkhead associated (FHA) protein
MTMELIIQESGKPARRVEAVAGLSFGRASSNSCVLDDDSASSRHAQLVLLDGRLQLQDLGSSNGTRVVGGDKLGRDAVWPLRAGVSFQIGRTLITVAVSELEEGTLVPAGKEAATAVRAPVDAPTIMPRAAAVVPPPGEDATMRPAPAPAPVVQAAPAPVQPSPVQPAPQKPAQQKPITVDQFEGTLYVGNAANDPAALQALLAALRPRLVCTVKKTGRVELIEQVPAVIGRAKTDAAGIALEDEGVSSRHAQLGFDGATFYIEDLGGRNGTYVGATRLTANGGKSELKCDQHVRFGSVDALFVREARTGEALAPALHYAGALEQLQAESLVPKERLREARAKLDSGAHPGEHLILTGAVTVEQWCTALEQARLHGVLQRGTSQRRSPLVWILAAALVVALGALGYLLSQ